MDKLHSRAARALAALLLLAAAHAAANATGSVTFVTWREPNENAFSMDVPQGWAVSGGMRRLSPVDARPGVQIVSPDGAIRLFLGDVDVAPFRELDPLLQRMGAREGMVYGGALIARYLDGAQFAERYPQWKLCPQPRIVQSGLLRRETETLNAQIAQFGRSMGIVAGASIGEALFRCGDAEGFVMATTLFTRPPGGQGVAGWFVYQLAGFTTRDPQQGYFAKYVLSSMLASLRTNPAWDARSAQTAGQYAQQAMQISNAVTQTAIAHARQQAAQGSAGGWNHPNNANLPKVTRDPASERNRDNANRGTRRVCDDLGTCKTVDNAWQNVWRDHNGNVVPGSASGYPPDYSGQWTKMQ